MQAGAKSVVGVDFSSTAAGAAQRRANELRLACRYIVGVVPGVPLAGMKPLSLAEYPEPFWRPGGVRAAAWEGRLPNTYTLLAQET